MRIKSDTGLLKKSKNMKIPYVPNSRHISEAMEKAMKDYAKKMLKEHKKSLSRQHLLYKLTGACHPMLDKMIKR